MTDEIDEKHELTNIDTSGYTADYWFSEIKSYLINVIGMNDKQVKKEFDTRFPELLVTEFDLITHYKE